MVFFLSIISKKKKFNNLESLRKYPPVSNLTRTCNREYHVEGTNYVIKKGQLVMIPANAIQNDPDIYPQPEIYNPDRFAPEEANKRSPYAFLAFGHGARNCIGLYCHETFSSFLIKFYLKTRSRLKIWNDASANRTQHVTQQLQIRNMLQVRESNHFCQ